MICHVIILAQTFLIGGGYGDFGVSGDLFGSVGCIRDVAV